MAHCIKPPLATVWTHSSTCYPRESVAVFTPAYSNDYGHGVASNNGRERVEGDICGGLLGMCSAVSCVDLGGRAQLRDNVGRWRIPKEHLVVLVQDSLVREGSIVPTAASGPRSVLALPE